MFTSDGSDACRTERVQLVPLLQIFAQCFILDNSRRSIAVQSLQYLSLDVDLVLLRERTAGQILTGELLSNIVDSVVFFVYSDAHSSPLRIYGVDQVLRGAVKTILGVF